MITTSLLIKECPKIRIWLKIRFPFLNNLHSDWLRFFKTNISHWFINMNSIWFYMNCMVLFIATGRSYLTTGFLIQAEAVELLREAH